MSRSQGLDKTSHHYAQRRLKYTEILQHVKDWKRKDWFHFSLLDSGTCLLPLHTPHVLDCSRTWSLKCQRYLDWSPLRPLKVIGWWLGFGGVVAHHVILVSALWFQLELIGIAFGGGISIGSRGTWIET